MPLLKHSLQEVTTSISQVEPVTPAEAKLHLRVAEDDVGDDALIDRCVTAARRQVEADIMAAIVNRQFKRRLDCFPVGDDIELPMPTVVNTTSLSVVYVPTTGGSATFASTNYTVDVDQIPGYVRLKDGASWPSTKDQPNAVTITFEAGLCGATTDADYDRSKIDPRIKQAVLMLTDEYFCDRSPEGAPMMGYLRLVRALRWAGYR